MSICTAHNAPCVSICTAHDDPCVSVCTAHDDPCASVCTAHDDPSVTICTAHDGCSSYYGHAGAQANYSNLIKILHVKMVYQIYNVCLDWTAHDEWSS